MKSLASLTLLFIVGFLQTGCTTAVVGGAIAGGAVAIDNRTTGDFVEDQNIKTKFASLYYGDDELSDKTHVNFTSYNRQVLITGEAPSEALKQRLSTIASQIKNVRHYYNEVVIGQPSSMSSRTNDAYITSKIKTSVLARIKTLDGAQVKVVTENGTVFLMGLVTRHQGDQITDIARTTRGVKRVVKLFEYPNPNDKRI